MLEIIIIILRPCFSSSIQYQLTKIKSSMNPSQSIATSHLITVLTNEVLRCAQLMHQLSKNAKVMFKEFDDPVTEIDYAIQNQLTNTIKQQFPLLRIVGEEDEEKMKNILSSASKQIQLTVPQINIPEEYETKNLLNVEQLCVWIDPLDCTRGYVCNNRHECTILVGVTLNGVPIIGVIGQTYKKSENSFGQKYEYEPTVNIGCIFLEEKCCLQYDLLKDNWKILKKSKQGSKKIPIVATSSRRESEKQIRFFEATNAIRQLIGGAGSKYLKVIRNEVDALCFIDAKTSKWDSCAGQAIVKAMGGFTIQPDLTCISYNPQATNYLNQIGFVSTLDQQFYLKGLTVLEDLIWKIDTFKSQCSLMMNNLNRKHSKECSKLMKRYQKQCNQMDNVENIENFNGKDWNVQNQALKLVSKMSNKFSNNCEVVDALH